MSENIFVPPKTYKNIFVPPQIFEKYFRTPPNNPLTPYLPLKVSTPLYNIHEDKCNYQIIANEQCNLIRWKYLPVLIDQIMVRIIRKTFTDHLQINPNQVTNWLGNPSVSVRHNGDRTQTGFLAQAFHYRSFWWSSQ